jgi:hypothetical protein
MNRQEWQQVQMQKRARAERAARETARLDRALARIGPGGCPWCYSALFSAWDYSRDRPGVHVNHDRRCLGPSSGWHKRVATDWLLAMLDVNGFRVADYGEDGLARHHTARAPA